MINLDMCNYLRINTFSNGIVLAALVNNPGSMPVPVIRDDWGSFCASIKRVQVTVNPSWLKNPQAAESSKVRNSGYQWPHKINLGQKKKKKN